MIDCSQSKLPELGGSALISFQKGLIMIQLCLTVLRSSNFMAVTFGLLFSIDNFSLAADPEKCDEPGGEFPSETRLYSDESTPPLAISYLSCGKIVSNNFVWRLVNFKVTGGDSIFPNAAGIGNNETDLLQSGFQANISSESNVFLQHPGKGFSLQMDQLIKWNGKYLSDGNLRFQSKDPVVDRSYPLRARKGVKPTDPDYSCSQMTRGHRLNIIYSNISNKKIQLDANLCTSLMSMGGTRTAIVSLNLKKAEGGNLFSLSYEDKRMSWLETHHDDFDALTFKVEDPGAATTYESDSSAIQIRKGITADTFYPPSLPIDSSAKGFMKISKLSFMKLAKPEKDPVFGDIQTIPFVMPVRLVDGSGLMGLEIHVIDPTQVKSPLDYIKTVFKFRGSNELERMKKYLIGRILVAKNKKERNGEFPARPAGLLLFQLEPGVPLTFALLNSTEELVGKALAINRQVMAMDEGKSISWPSYHYCFPNGSQQELQLKDLLASSGSFVHVRCLQNENLE